VISERFMNAVSSHPAGQPYALGNAFRPVTFYCLAPAAKAVELAGDFNHWHTVPMHQRVDGWWFIQLELPHGHHQYRFLVDGEPTLDPRATGTAQASGRQLVSLIAVS
jgi:1,4-alpha-glucan branching enzyme